jgi:hypothetical protein
MINRLELRLGNQLQNLRVIELLRDHMVARVIGDQEVEVRYEDAEAFHISREVLEMCGFVFRGDSVWGSHHQSPLWLNFETNGWYIRMDNAYVNRSHPIRTLHHLQNAWFDLTGQELRFESGVEA